MDKCKIVIPSYKRADILIERTLPLVLKSNIKAEDIYIFVVQEELEEYSEKINNKSINIIVGKKGIKEQRGFIAEYFKDDQFILTLDDDVKKIQELEGEKLVNVKDLDMLNKKVYKTMIDNGSKCCGVYPTNNPYFMKPVTTHNLKFCIGAMRWFINDSFIEMNRYYTLLEDYEVSLKYYLEYKTITRLSYIAIEHDFNKLRGGLKETTDRSFEAKEAEVIDFRDKYKLYTTINDRYLKSGRQIDIRFKKCRNNSK